jgi:hemoglobin
MIAEYIRYSIPQEESQDLERAYSAAAIWLDQSPHCLSYELSRCSEDPSQFILRIEWASHDAHLKGFRSSPEFRGFYKEISAFIPHITEMRHYDLTSVAKKKSV